jgi:two-component system OmpR family sensor kinase
MRLRRRLVTTMIVLVALGLAAVNVITLTSLHSYLFGRTDAQLTAVSSLVSSYVLHAEKHGHPVTPGTIESRVSPDLYVEIIDASGTVLVSRPSGTAGQADPAPDLPAHLPVLPSHRHASARTDEVYRPDASSINVGSDGGHGPQYRLQATSLPGETLVVATSLTSVNATLDSLRTIELLVSLSLLAALAILMTLLIRLGLRPLEDMTQEADAIAAGDLTRRVQPIEGEGEIARMGRAFNGMLAQIETAFAQRARSEERLRSFLADASHELRTPLTSIRGYAELLRKDALTDGEARDRALSRIEKEAARVGTLVGDLSVLAREGQGPEPVYYRVDLAAVAAEAVADASTIDADRRIELTADGEVPVAGDDARLEQLVHNLLGNALSHTPAGTPVEVGVTVRGDKAVLRVHDQGPGLTSEQASRVFDRFYRGDADSRDGGSGLGLFIVASLARTFGGQATVESAEGQGATFEVTLPVYGSEGSVNESPVNGSSANGNPAKDGPAKGSPAKGAPVDEVSVNGGGEHHNAGHH